MELDRYTEIERENRILLEKMTTIMSQKPKVPEYSSRSIVFPNPSSHRQYGHNKSNISQGRSRENSRMSSQGSHSPASSRSGSANNRSLNYEARKRETAKIRDENFNMLQRLRSKKSVYNVNKWEEEDSKR
jgi:hypothetical protein